MVRIYQSLTTGVLMTPVKQVGTGLYLFRECDAFGNETLEPRAWNNNAKPVPQSYLVGEPFDGKTVELTP